MFVSVWVCVCVITSFVVLQISHDASFIIQLMVQFLLMSLPLMENDTNIVVVHVHVLYMYG